MTNQFVAKALESKKLIEGSAPSLIPENVLQPVPEFDLDALLPESIRWWILDEASRSGAPIEYVAVGALVAMGNLLGPKITVQPKRHDSQWQVRTNLWGAAIGDPSTKKTPGLQAGLRILREIEKASAKELKDGEAQHKAQKKVFASKQRVAQKHLEKLQAKAIDNDVSTADLQAAEQEVISLAMQDHEPSARRYLVNDATVEALGELLQHSPGLIQFRDELSGWLNVLNKEDRQNDRAFFLEAFNGTGDYTYDRIGRGTVHIEKNIVGLLGGIQPGKLKPLVMSAVNGGSDNDGLLQRFQLMVYPDKPKNRDEDREPHEDSLEAAREVFAHLNSLPARDNALRLDDEAYTVFTQWRHDLEDRVAHDADMHPAVQGHLIKYVKLCIALSAVFATIDKCQQVPPGAVRRAMAWCEFLEAHAMRVYGMTDTAAFEGARLIISRRDKLDKQLKVKMIQQKGWTGLSETKAVKEALEVLVEYGWLEEMQNGGLTYIWRD